MLRLSAVVMFVGAVLHCNAQTDKPEINWQNQDYSLNKTYGVSTEKAYNELLKDKKNSEVIVAVLDSGIDVEHEDLAANIWVNEDEIPNNGIDDDGNGYIDDINGWNFIGGAEKDVHHDNLEFTRIYKKLKNKFGKMDEDEVSLSDKKEYDKYLKFKKDYKTRVEGKKAEKEDFMPIYKAYKMSLKWAKKETGSDEPSLKEIEDLNPTTEREEAFQGLLTSEKYYGNNHVEGPDARHGTHVAGIIAGVRGNDLGLDGIASNVKIMSVRVVPDGDERDKDVANAIRYAVDNGAKIINMSFGKSYSPGKSVVDDAAQYASDKGVLLIHAAGNSDKNIDRSDNFPNDMREDSDALISNWIEVGSSTSETDKHLVSSFSNYGVMGVDVFAPGSDIYSTVPDNEYEYLSGTSMAAPTVAGVAALVWSYYPNLTASELKQILLESSVIPKPKKVIIPGELKKKTKFKNLSVTSGIVNAYNACKLAALKS